MLQWGNIEEQINRTEQNSWVIDVENVFKKIMSECDFVEHN